MKAHIDERDITAAVRWVAAGNADGRGNGTLAGGPTGGQGGDAGESARGQTPVTYDSLVRTISRAAGNRPPSPGSMARPSSGPQTHFLRVLVGSAWAGAFAMVVVAIVKVSGVALDHKSFHDAKHFHAVIRK
jgi:hypothetical protein